MGVDSVYKQVKPEVTLREILENAAETHTIGTRFVSTSFVVKRKVLELIQTHLLLSLFHIFH